MDFSRNLLRRGYGGQEERKGRKGVGGRLHALDGTESGEIVKFYEAGNYSKKIW